MPESKSKTLRRHIGENVRTIRTAQRMTGGELAQRMRSLGYRWDAAQVSRVERGARPVTIEVLVGLSIAFDRPLWRLLDTSDGHDAIPVVEVGPGIVLASSELGSLASMSPRNVWRTDEHGNSINLSMRHPKVLARTEIEE